METKMLAIIRELEVTNGTTTKTLVVEKHDEQYKLWDPENDPHSDSLKPIESPNDSSIQDVLVGDWEIV